jgi:hypothetical protein
MSASDDRSYIQEQSTLKKKKTHVIHEAQAIHGGHAAIGESSPEMEDDGEDDYGEEMGESP